MNIIPVKHKNELKEFIQLPWKIYQDDSNWVPPLRKQMKEKFNSDKYPYYEFAEVQPFLATKRGKVVGRIAAHINQNHNKLHNEKTGFFGFFESIPDIEVTRRLTETAADWVKSKGMNRLRGPMNFSTNEVCGLLIEGFHQPPLIMMPYNPKYYQTFLENCGFRKAKDLWAFYVAFDEMPKRYERFVKRLKKRSNFKLRKLNPKKFEEEVSTAFEIYNNAWQHNWGFVPMTEKEFRHTAKDLKQIVDFDLVYIIEKDGKPVAFSLTVPDVNQALIQNRSGRLFPFGWLKLLLASRDINQVRVITLGIIDDYKNQGLDAVLYYESIKNALEKGMARGEMSWMLEDNYAIINAMKKMGGEHYKTYRIYDKNLS